ncbi:Rieske (2Fe-2S) protein [Mucilaginibacter sp.]
MPWYEVAATASIADRQVLNVKAEGKSLCLVRAGNIYFATQLRCPHAGGDLSGGWCEQGKLVCPLHRYSYDLQTGKGSSGQGDYINIYAVKTESGKIFVEVKGFTDKLKRLFK